MSNFTSVHRCVRNDGDECRTYAFTWNKTEIEAYENIINDYMDNCRSEPENELESIHNRNLIISYMMKNKITLFKWEWERKGNFDAYFVMYTDTLDESRVDNGTEMDEILKTIGLRPPV